MGWPLTVWPAESMHSEFGVNSSSHFPFRVRTDRQTHSVIVDRRNWSIYPAAWEMIHCTACFVYIRVLFHRAMLRYVWCQWVENEHSLWLSSLPMLVIGWWVVSVTVSMCVCVSVCVHVCILTKIWLELSTPNHYYYCYNFAALCRSRWRKQIGMIDDHDECEWVNVSSGTSSPGLSRTNSTEP